MASHNKFPLISVILPTLNGSDRLKRCLSSFFHTVRRRNIEFIVVDDGSDPVEKSRIRKMARTYGVQLLENEKRQSYAISVNRGIQKATGDYLLFLNNDIVFHQPDWIHRLIQTSQEAKNIGVVGCRLVYPDQTLQHAGGVLKRDYRYVHLFRGKPKNYKPARCTYDVVSVTGALMLIKREVVTDIGGLCEDYPLSYEDVDFCLRARQTGWRIVYCGSCWAVHEEGVTRGRVPEEKPEPWYEEEVRSHAIFWNRWIDHEQIRPMTSYSVDLLLNTKRLLSFIPWVHFITGLREQGVRVKVHAFDREVPIEEVRKVLDSKQKILTNDQNVATTSRQFGVSVILVRFDPDQPCCDPHWVYQWLNRISENR